MVGAIIMVDYDWRILSMKNHSANGGVFEVHWVCAGIRSKIDEQDQTHTYEMSQRGMSTFEPDPESGDFVAFDNLTEAKVWEWINQEIDRDGIEKTIADRLQKLYFDDSIDETIPWASAGESQE